VAARLRARRRCELRPWQLVTYAFLHGGLMHLAFNMFALYMFGGAIEQVLGTRRYLAYYFVCAVSAALTQLVFALVTGGVYPVVGASGAVFGLLLAYAMYFPNNRVMLIFPADSDAGADVRIRVRRARAVPGRERDAGRSRPLRTSRRDDRRLRDAPLLERTPRASHHPLTPNARLIAAPAAGALPQALARSSTSP
jgi:hypothetical protein